MSRIIGRKILYYERVTSTNDLIREWAESGEPEGLVITAEEQTAGRGRLGRSWRVPPRSSVQLSVLLRPPFPPRAAQSITQAAALAVASTLYELAVASSRSPLPEVALKWPNDVLLNGKKCAGILVESGVEAETFAFAVLGIGINVNYSMRDYPELAAFATTLADELGHPVEKDTLQEALLAKLDEHYARLQEGEQGRTALFEEWRAQLSTLGCAVRVVTPTGTAEGIAEDVDGDGALLLRRDEDVIRLYSGDVTLLKDPAQRSLK